MTSKIAEMRMKTMNGELEENLTLKEALEKVAREKTYRELPMEEK